jgi:hypothetical protein
MNIRVILIGLFALTSCNLFQPAETPTCASDDSACWVEHMNLYDESENLIDTVLVDAANIPYTGSGTLPSGSSVSYPYYTGTNHSDFESIEFMVWGIPGNLTPLIQLDWEDPTGWKFPNCTCARCPRNVRCITGRCRCTRGRPDGIIKGTWITKIGFEAGPADSSTDVSLPTIFIPVSSTTSTDDPIVSLQNNDTGKVVVGPQIGTTVLVLGKDRPGGPGSGGSGAGGSGGGGGGISYAGTYNCTSVATSPAGTANGQGSFSCGATSCTGEGTFKGSISATGVFDGTTTLCASCNTLRIQGQMSTTSTFTLSGSAGSTSMTMTCRKS